MEIFSNLNSARRLKYLIELGTCNLSLGVKFQIIQQVTIRIKPKLYIY